MKDDGVSVRAFITGTRYPALSIMGRVSAC